MISSHTWSGKTVSGLGFVYLPSVRKIMAELKSTCRSFSHKTSNTSNVLLKASRKLLPPPRCQLNDFNHEIVFVFFVAFISVPSGFAITNASVSKGTMATRSVTVSVWMTRLHPIYFHGTTKNDEDHDDILRSTASSKIPWTKTRIVSAAFFTLTSWEHPAGGLHSCFQSA
jgi:hypothetical protein